MEKIEIIEKYLPGFNCGICGYKNCHEFAMALQIKSDILPNCTVLSRQKYEKGRAIIEAYLNNFFSLESKKKIKGLIDEMEADFILKPLSGEISCRETLVNFSSKKVREGDLVRYRPLGCPITHYARVISEKKGLIDVWIEGPARVTEKDEIHNELGICLILSFQGEIEGNLPNIGQTVKFLPKHCMMGKVHSGIIVQIEDRKVRIDAIDLKVWQHATNPVMSNQPAE